VTLADAMDALGPLVVDPPPPAALGTRLVTAIAYDSRRVSPGALFVALRGLRADGTAFAAQAASRGAAAVVAESARVSGVDAPWIRTSDARLALALLADRFYDHPSRRMPVIGVTGTNGKTTTAYLLAAMLDAAGRTAGIMGTVVYRVGREEREAGRTTPEAPDVQQLLAEMIARGCRAAVMEVSSHALALKRVDGIAFAAAIFTNLTRDHLDFHEDMEAYFAAKRRLFEMLPADAWGIINADDPRATSLGAACGRAWTYGLTSPADVTVTGLSSDLGGLTLDVRTPRGSVALRSPLVGRPNAYNILAATAAAAALDVPLDAIAAGVHALRGVPGRFEVVSSPADEVTVVVDYAHTDDALRNLLETARPLARHRLLTVFGCGGDRDKTKRPLMGMVAARLSDGVIITSDNPRSEDPDRIIEDIKRGIPGSPQAGVRAASVVAITDRAEAIAQAVAHAQPGDLVLIAGKGHEKYQQIGDRVLPFDDAAVARDALARRAAARSKAAG
jgi:UDP-N-acetylmuramoyl-L-alanyl-D-glutamate--2,6-diaminopimelate ligase